MAKIAREQAVRERRARKQEKRELKRAAKLNPENADPVVDGETPYTDDRPNLNSPSLNSPI